jgi:hypothetical protein
MNLTWSNVACVSHPFGYKLNHEISLYSYQFSNLYFITPFISCQYEGGAVYFESLQCISFALYILLLSKLGAFHQSDNFMSWFSSYLARFVLWECIHHCLECSLVFLSCIFWCVILSVYLLMIYTIQLSSLLLIALKFVIPLSVLMIAPYTVLH